MNQPDTDEIVLAKHRSGLRFTLAPNFNNGELSIWIEMLPRSWQLMEIKSRQASTYRNRAKFAAFLREAAKRIERA